MYFFVAFTAEELGTLGSIHYTRNAAVPAESTVAMVNFDMVGRLRDNRLLALGAASAAEFPALLDSINREHHFDLRASGDGWGPSDQQSFYAVGVPVVHFFTDTHEQYHRTSDDAGLINVDGIARIARGSGPYSVEPTKPMAKKRRRPTPIRRTSPSTSANRPRIWRACSARNRPASVSSSGRSRRTRRTPHRASSDAIEFLRRTSCQVSMTLPVLLRTES